MVYPALLPLMRTPRLPAVDELTPLPIIYVWSDNKVRELTAAKVLHTSLLNTTVFAFKVLPLESYAPMPAPSPPFKTILELVLWNGTFFSLRKTDHPLVNCCFLHSTIPVNLH